MQKTRTIFLVLVVVAFVSLLALGNRGSGTGGRLPISIGQQAPPDDEAMPIADYHAPKRTDGKGAVRARKFGNRGLVLTEEPTNLSIPLPVIDHRFTKMPALPVEQSDAIIVGSVTGASAYLSDDRTSVVSEFIILVTDILKSNKQHPLTSGGSIVGLRDGGAVRYPSGRILRFSALHQHFPESGKRYAFFLKYDADSDDFEILTGYELREGAVFPLDGSRNYGAQLSFAKYSGVSIDQFFNELRETLSNSASGRKGGKGGNQ